MSFHGSLEVPFMRKALLLCALCLPAAAAHADVVGLYVGAGVTTGSVDNVLNSGVDIRNTDWKVFAGVHPSLSPVGLELEYLDFGSEDRNFVHAEANAAALDAIGYLPLPLPFLSVYAKAGVSRWEVKASEVASQVITLDDHGTQFTFGAGAQVHFGNVAVRVEYERFNIVNTDGAGIVTLGMQLTLL
jgi:opacity protein-like surface antigen